ncbi:hypothetical protein L914_02946 [Phytophthora nicotianae]|uniref:Uncharacterized protein n=1 Tax=Phytophthora nicotianae TaxID=4792 RepID=W2P0Y7_PHYNI|nr:hypothetical protein L914_02946 [Phytophthora nicotianae]
MSAARHLQLHWILLKVEFWLALPVANFLLAPEVTARYC